jgi:hypothetical protein
MLSRGGSRLEVPWIASVQNNAAKICGVSAAKIRPQKWRYDGSFMDWATDIGSIAKTCPVGRILSFLAAAK